MARIIDIDVELPVFMRSVEQIQADWNQNDNTQPDYINHRICYEEETSTSEVVLFDVVLNSSGCITGYAYQDNAYFVPVSFPKGFTIDKYTTYTVTLGDQTLTYNFNGANNTIFSGDGIQGGGAVLIENAIPNSLDCDMAFNFNYNPLAYDGLHFKQVVQVTNDGINKIDEKFLPEGIGSEKRESVTIFDRDFNSDYFVWDYEPLKLGNRYKMTITYLFDTEYTSTTIVTPVYDSVYDTYTLPFSISYLNAQTGYPSNTSGALNYNASSTPEYSGNYGFTGGHMKLEKLLEIKKIDNKFLNTSEINLVNGSGSGSLKSKNAYSSTKNDSVALGNGTKATGTYAFAAGYNTTASGLMGSFAVGRSTTASGQSSAAIGYDCIASGGTSISLGRSTTASQFCSVAAGCGAQSTGQAAVAMGYYPVASGTNSVSLGNYSEATGEASFATNYSTKASSKYSAAFGNSSKASGESSFACGQGTEANHKSQFTFGEYNVQDSSAASASARGNYIEIVGNGTNASARSNARTLDWSGNETLSGTLRIGSTSTGGALLKFESNTLKVSFDDGATWGTVQITF